MEIPSEILNKAASAAAGMAEANSELANAQKPIPSKLEVTITASGYDRVSRFEVDGKDVGSPEFKARQADDRSQSNPLVTGSLKVLNDNHLVDAHIIAKGNVSATMPSAVDRSVIDVAPGPGKITVDIGGYQAGTVETTQRPGSNPTSIV